MEPKIVSCTIIVGGHWEENHVRVQLDNGVEKELFSYFPDELYFSEGEFIGLTETQAHDLKYNKDRAYLRS